MSVAAHSTAEVDAGPFTVRLGPAVVLTDDQLFEICRLNRDLRLERTSQGDLVIMPPTGGETGARNAKIILQLGRWAEEDGTGVAFDSSTGFVLPNGAMRSPDASWVRRSRLAPLRPAEREKFLPLCPDFVVELRSPSDDLDPQRQKLAEYLDNGAALGLLIDPLERRVYRYAADEPVQVFTDPAEVSGEPLLPGFRLRLEAIWKPGW